MLQSLHCRCPHDGSDGLLRFFYRLTILYATAYPFRLSCRDLSTLNNPAGNTDA